MVFIPTSCIYITGTDTDTNTSSNKSQILVMLYMGADNDLSSSAYQDLNEMANANIDYSKVQVVGLVDFNGTNDTRLFTIKSNAVYWIIDNSAGFGENVEKNTADPQTLKAFLDYVYSHYSADYYVLIIWDHGEGWRNLEIPKEKKEVAYKAIVVDETGTTTIMFNDQIQSVVKNYKINVMAFDACLMGLLETAYEFRKSVTGIDYLVFSQEFEPGGGYNYTDLLQRLNKLSVVDAKNIAIKIAESYYYTYSSFLPSLTISVIDLSKLDDIINSLNYAIDNVLANKTQAELDQALMNATRFLDATYIDLVSFLLSFSNEPAIQTVISAVKTSVITNFYGIEKTNTYGLSIFLPPVYKDSLYNDTSNILNIDFLTASKWDNFVNSRTFGYTIDTTEPNDTFATSIAVTNGQIVQSYIIDPQEKDVYKINVTGSGTLVVALSNIPPDCDYDLFLFDSTGSKIAESANEGNNPENISTIVNPGRYYVVVSGYIGYDLKNKYSLYFSGDATY